MSSDLLKWKRRTIGMDGKSILNAFISPTIYFSILEVTDGKNKGRWHWRFNVCRAIFGEGYESTEEEAKAACQLIYDQHSLSEQKEDDE